MVINRAHSTLPTLLLLTLKESFSQTWNLCLWLLLWLLLWLRERRPPSPSQLQNWTDCQTNVEMWPITGSPAWSTSKRSPERVREKVTWAWHAFFASQPFSEFSNWHFACSCLISINAFRSHSSTLRLHALQNLTRLSWWHFESGLLPGKLCGASETDW